MNETEITLDERGGALLLKVSEETVLGLSGTGWEAIGQRVSAAFIRRQNDLLCKRDGHTVGDFGNCDRCGSVIDLARWESLQTSGRSQG